MTAKKGEGDDSGGGLTEQGDSDRREMGCNFEAGGRWQKRLTKTEESDNKRAGSGGGGAMTDVEGGRNV